MWYSIKFIKKRGVRTKVHLRYSYSLLYSARYFVLLEHIEKWYRPPVAVGDLKFRGLHIFNDN